MVANKKTTPAAAYVAAKAQREDAERGHEAALAVVEQARQAQETLRTKLLDGDASVTASQLAATDADIERTTLLAEAAARAVQNALEAERTHAAAHLADLVAPIADPGPLHAAQCSAAQVISAELSRLAGLAADQQAVVRGALAVAKELGLRDATVAAGRALGREQLMLNGQPVIPTPVGVSMVEALVQGVEGAQWRFPSKPELRVIEQPVDRSDIEDQPLDTWDALLREIKHQRARAAVPSGTHSTV